MPLKLTDEMRVLGPYEKPNGRKFVVIIERSGKRRTMAYPKWLMSEHLGRELSMDETVDHWDSDLSNNSIENFRILPRDVHSAEDTKRVYLVKCKCSWCDKEFERSPRLLRERSKKNKSGPFCSKSCAGKYARSIQLKLVDKFDVQPSVDSTYYKRKYVEASLSILEKYDDIEFEFEDIFNYF